MKGSSTSPPPFSWDDGYASVADPFIAEVDAIFREIREYQYQKFEDPLTAETSRS